MLSMATATLRLIAESWINARPEPSRPGVAMATRPPEPPPPSTAHELASRAATAITAETDLASRAAAAARTEVERSFGISNAKIVESVVARRVGGGSSVDGVKRPRYQAEVVVEIPRGLGLPIQRRYFLTLQYVGGGKWQAERMEFVTRY
jgi:hypothetical protein